MSRKTLPLGDRAPADIRGILDLISESPDLESLDAQSIGSVARYALLRKYSDRLLRDADLLEFDYLSVKDEFLDGFVKCPNTRMSYENALAHFEDYIASIGISNPFSIGFEQADGFVRYLEGKGFSNGSIRQFFAAVSSLFSFAARLSDGKLRNVFAGSLSKPKRKTRNAGKFYDKGVNEPVLRVVRSDLEIIRSSFKSASMRAIVGVMIDSGLRVGAFTSHFSHDGVRFKTLSKGKQVTGTLSRRSQEDFRLAGIDTEHSFKDWSADKIKNLFKYHSAKLRRSAAVSFDYSCHDARHYFAITSYLACRDIYAVSKMLGHSSVAVTESYLRGLNVALDAPAR